MGIQRHETSQTWKPLTFFCEAFDLWVRGIPLEMGWLVVELAKLCGPYPLVRWFVGLLLDSETRTCTTTHARCGHQEATAVA